MRYASIRSLDISNGEDIGVSLFTQGCRRACTGCFNQGQWSFSGGEAYTAETEELIINLLSKSYIKRFSLLGGEPLENENLYHLAKLCKRIKRDLPHIKIWLYTGNIWENIIETINSNYKNQYLEPLLNNIDVMVDGDFQKEKKDLTLKFRGSSNQRVIDVRKSLKQGTVVLMNIGH